MGKLDIKLVEFHNRITELKTVIPEEMKKLNDVLNEDYERYPEHPMFKIDQMIVLYKRLAKLNGRFAYVIGNKIEITGMFSAAGRVAISKVVRKFVSNYHKDVETAVKVFNKEYQNVAKTHLEVTDTAVTDSIYWYLQPFMEIYDIEDKFKL